MRTILLVEDELVIALAASLALEDAGFRVLLAADGVEGLAKAKAERPDLILTDYMMPRMNGLAMIEALRREGIATPVILATAISLEALPAGAYDAVLSKPYQDKALLDTVHRLLEGRDRQD